MNKKMIAALAAMSLLFTAAGCQSDSSSSSESESSSSSSASAETTTAETSEAVELTGTAPAAEELGETLMPFHNIRFQVPESWANMSVTNLCVWYPSDNSGAVTIQFYEDSDLENFDLSADSDHKTVLETLGKKLADGQTVVSEVWNTLLDGDAYAITYTPESDTESAQQANLSVLFYAEGSPYAMTFSNYTGTSTVLKTADSILASVVLASEVTTTEASETETETTEAE